MSPSQLSDAPSADSHEVERFRFVVPGRLEYRDAARAFLAYVCDRLAGRGRLPPDLGHRVISAFVEAFNNAVIHAYDNGDPGPVEVEMEVHEDHLCVRILDEGQTFVPEKVPEPDLDALPEGGLGLFIIRNFMDRVRYERSGDKNVLTMEKDLRPSNAPTDDEEQSER
jgi:anti-sigma regulatory factor (Ser/Thr protein kinase)